MRKLYFAIISAIVLLTSCVKGDDNGALRGNWQLAPNVYFAIYTDMALWRNTEKSGFYMGYFRHVGDAITLTLKDGTPGICRNDGSKDYPVVDASLLPAEFHVPADFTYRIVSLKGSELVLNNGTEELKFRRY